LKKYEKYVNYENIMSKIIPIMLLLAGIYVGYNRLSGGGGVKFPMKVISNSAPARNVPESEQIPVILFTGTEWCPACVNLDKSVIKTDQWQEFADKEIKFRSFDFPADQSRVPPEIAQLAQNYEVTGFPTLLVLDRNHEVIGRQVGSGPPVENYKEWIRGHQELYAKSKAIAMDEGSEQVASTSAE